MFTWNWCEQIYWNCYNVHLLLCLFLVHNKLQANSITNTQIHTDSLMHVFRPETMHSFSQLLFTQKPNHIYHHHTHTHTQKERASERERDVLTGQSYSKPAEKIQINLTTSHVMKA